VLQEIFVEISAFSKMSRILFFGAGLTVFGLGIVILLAATIVGWGVLPGVIDDTIEEVFFFIFL